ncbi:TolC family outer membrane protein [Aquabacterium sp.]|uniref:TolC family outer membrane protein n=1 Tax=Aquabacterium sp. TaxID=1872578 RepID=UPI0037830B83
MPSLNLRPLTPRLHLLALAIGMLGAASAQAQSLKELYEIARNYDAPVLAARAQADSTKYKVARAEGSLLPSASLNGSANRAESDPAGPVGTLGTTTQKLELQAKYPLFNRTNAVSLEQAKRADEIAQADLATAEQDLIVRLAQAYFDELTAQDALSAASANKKAIAEQLASAKRNFEVGTATITDTREAQARYDGAVASEIAAENDLRTKRIALDQLVGQANVTPKPLAVPITLPTVSPSNAEEWVTMADGSHPSIRKARLGYDVAKLDTELARAATLPTVDLVGGVSGTYASGSGVIASGGRPGTTKSAQIGVQASYTLFAGGSLDARIKETVVLEDKARNDLENARRSVAQGTRQAFYSTQSLQAQAKALEAAEASNKLALEATQLGYKVGVRVNLDVLNAQTQLFNAQRDLSKARHDTIVTSLKLRQAAGQLSPQDVQAVDALLAR